MRGSSKVPFMSVVVISHNGAQSIGRTLESLANQNYPLNRYEIIVVDDASTDETAALAGSYLRVRVVHLAKNQGVSGARNAGLAAARGDVYVAFDDDCIAETNWLKHLAEGYRSLDKVAGIGGVLEHTGPVHGLVSKFISAKGGPAPEAKPTAEVPLAPLQRLLRYIRSNLRHTEKTVRGPFIPVTELYGANGSFPVAVLREVGGWRLNMSGIEDRDISHRIHAQFPERQFYVCPKAQISHEDPKLSVGRYLLRPYKRGPVTLKFHQENGLMPPLFPFPPVYLALLVLAALSGQWAAGAVIALAAPQFGYFWWPVYAWKRRNVTALLFSYLQLAEETMVLLGLLRGYTQTPKRQARVA